MAKQSKTVNAKAAAYFKELGISPDASVTVRTKSAGPKQSKDQVKVHTLLEICEGYAKATTAKEEAAEVEEATEE